MIPPFGRTDTETGANSYKDTNSPRFFDGYDIRAQVFQKMPKADCTVLP